MPEVVAVGHRGAPLLTVENTLASITAAAAAGADWVEVDVRLTREGTPVLLHDADLRRVWGRHERIDEVDLDRLPGRADGGLHAVPTLEEALDLATGLEVTLMIDLPGRPQARRSADLVLSADRTAAVVFTGDPDALALVRTRSHAVRIALSWEQPQLPPETLLDAVHPQLFNQRHDLLDARAVEQVHALGMAVSAYTVDDRAQMRALRDAGVDVVISNDIEGLVAVLRARAAGEAADVAG